MLGDVILEPESVRQSADTPTQSEIREILSDDRCRIGDRLVEIAYRPTFADWLLWLESDEHLLMLVSGNPENALWAKAYFLDGEKLAVLIPENGRRRKRSTGCVLRVLYGPFSRSEALRC